MEQKYSHYFHSKTVPVLISSLVVRQLGAGQVDLAFLVKRQNEWLLFLCEIKKFSAITRIQRQRYLKVAEIFAHSMKISVQRLLISGEKFFCQKA